jgi:hypothetical protein
MFSPDVKPRLPCGDKPQRPAPTFEFEISSMLLSGKYCIAYGEVPYITGR